MFAHVFAQGAQQTLPFWPPAPICVRPPFLSPSEILVRVMHLGCAAVVCITPPDRLLQLPRVRPWRLISSPSAAGNERQTHRAPLTVATHACTHRPALDGISGELPRRPPEGTPRNRRAPAHSHTAIVSPPSCGRFPCRDLRRLLVVAPHVRPRRASGGRWETIRRRTAASVLDRGTSSSLHPAAESTVPNPGNEAQSVAKPGPKSALGAS